MRRLLRSYESTVDADLEQVDSRRSCGHGLEESTDRPRCSQCGGRVAADPVGDTARSGAQIQRWGRPSIVDVRSGERRGAEQS